jgi:nitroreductase
MTSLIEPRLASAVRRAAVRATLAPSVHNTQPWRFVLGSASLEVYADWSRQLRVLDPRGRQLLVSCGCAIFNARVALAAAGYDAIVERFPDPGQSDLVARLRMADAVTERLPIGALDAVIELRRTNRRRFADDAVPTEVRDALVAIAHADGAELFPIALPQHRLATARLSRQADDLEVLDPAYRAELRAWTSDDPRRLDGVSAAAVPHVDSGAHALYLLGTAQDNPRTWLQAGEALEHLLLEITHRGYVASPLTQVIEVVATNIVLRRQLQLNMYPHVLLRVGRAPATPASRRRRLVDMLGEAE